MENNLSNLTSLRHHTRRKEGEQFAEDALADEGVKQQEDVGDSSNADANDKPFNSPGMLISKLPSRTKTTNIDVGVLTQLSDRIGINTPASKDNARDFAVSVRIQFNKRVAEINAAASKAFMIYESKCAKEGTRTEKTLLWFLDNELAKAGVPMDSRARSGLQRQITLANNRDNQYQKELEAKEATYRETLRKLNEMEQLLQSERAVKEREQEDAIVNHSSAEKVDKQEDATINNSSEKANQKPQSNVNSMQANVKASKLEQDANTLKGKTINSEVTDTNKSNSKDDQESDW
jgi:hypothetical protein